MQPLRIRNIVYRTTTSELRNPRICDVKGFRSVGSTVDEAGIVLPSSKNFQMYEELGIGNHKDISTKFIASPLRDSLVTVFDLSEKHAQDLVEEAGRQDN
eukprot:4932849-Pleurochrysis_carterae.AAC.1